MMGRDFDLFKLPLDLLITAGNGNDLKGHINFKQTAVDFLDGPNTEATGQLEYDGPVSHQAL